MGQNKQDQKALIIQMMQEDEKDGLYTEEGKNLDQTPTFSEYLDSLDFNKLKDNGPVEIVKAVEEQGSIDCDDRWFDAQLGGDPCSFFDIATSVSDLIEKDHKKPYKKPSLLQRIKNFFNGK